MDKLRREFEENGKSELFEALKGSLPVMNLRGAKPRNRWE